MKIFSLYLASLFVLFNTTTALANPVTFASNDKQVTLLELYTSEGCSSCPPADRWMSQLKSKPGLWKQFVPVAFHVDYWNYLGWEDRFSKPAYSKRQRDYATYGYTSTVYTPGFFQNGREWRSWFRTPQLGPADGVNSGPLRVTLDNGKLTAGFTPTKPVNAVLFLHITGLGFDIKTEVQGGENRGKILRHDFVVLSLNAYKEQLGQQTHHWTIDYPVKMLQQKNLKALAFWVTGEKDPTPLQATGGWIE